MSDVVAADLAPALPGSLAGRGTTVLRRATLFLLFFLSGFAALLYQVIWQRLLTLITGLDLQAATTIVAAFMVGMGLGSLAGGHLADRLRPSRLVAAFALAELAIALFALVSKTLYVDVFYHALGQRGQGGATLALGACVTLLFPTFFMGMTLPVLAKVVTHRADVAASRIGALYGWNTLGAACGAWLGSAWLIRTHGYERALWFGAALNVSCCIAAFVLLRRTPSPAPAPAPSASTDPTPAPLRRTLPFAAWLGIYFLSGFVALGLEMVWFRLLGVILKSNSFTFALLLALYLLGIGLGSLLGPWFARRARDPVGKFLLLQGLLAGYAALSLWALVTGVEFVAALRSVRDYLGSYEPIDFYFDFTAIAPDRLMLYLAVPAALILPPTLLMGVSFTFLQRAVQSNVNSLGRRLGWLQAMNIFGCTAGAVVVGIVLLHRFGTVGTLRVLVALSVVFWVLYFRRTRARLVATVLVGAAAALVPASATLWARLHGTQPGDIIHGEDGTGLSVLRNEREDFWFVRVFVNGLGQSWIPFHGVHTYLGLVPVLVHPEPRTIACIGLGSGDTAFALGGRPETQQVHCIEIIGSQLATLRALHDKKRYEGLGSLLGDARYQHVVGDGRRFLMHGGARFDIIEADALRPTSAYAGNLYSREYFELLRAHLQPHGLAVTWMPTERVYHTFVAVFPHVVQVEPMLLGSNEPIVIDKEAIRARAARPEIKSYYLRSGIDITPVVEEMLAAVKVVDKGTPAPASAHNTDLFPRDELYVR